MSSVKVEQIDLPKRGDRDELEVFVDVLTKRFDNVVDNLDKAINKEDNSEDKNVFTIAYMMNRKVIYQNIRKVVFESYNVAKYGNKKGPFDE